MGKNLRATGKYPAIVNKAVNHKVISAAVLVRNIQSKSTIRVAQCTSKLICSGQVDGGEVRRRSSKTEYSNPSISIFKSLGGDDEGVA